jgi:adenine phosphoribosyltransferase
MNLENYIRDIPNFPIEWINFKDISPLLSDPKAFKESIDQLAVFLEWADCVVWLDARGFIFWGALAYKLWIPFIPIRKAGKLPFDTISINYELEYWKNTFEIHTDAIKKWDNVSIVDDLLATGWTALAATQLVEKLWGNVHSINFVIDLTFLDWVKKLDGYNINSLLKY